MKHHLFLLFFIVLIDICSYAQKSTNAIFYAVKYVGDSLNPERKGEDLMVLWVGEGYSVFQSYYGFQRDSIVKASSTGSATEGNIAGILGKAFSVKAPVFKYMIHKDFKARNISAYETLFFDNYKYDQALGPLPWKIQTETKTILGYKAQKATLEYSGRSFTAWFAEEIPINDGPYIFNGLPGLILEIEDSQRHYSFSIIGIEKRAQELEGLTLKNPINLPKNSYYKLKRDMYSDISKAFIGRPQGSISAQDMQEVQAKYNRANNPLEKKVF